MTRKEKLNMIEDVLEVELGSLKESDLLSKISEYDSMSKLSLSVMCDEEFEKKLSGEQIRQFKTVCDILDFLE